jgi:maltose alpha-D-glucosyltransferase / alpha-amylase
MRKECPEIGWGTFQLERTPPGVLAVRHSWRGNAVITLHNFTAEAREVKLTLAGHEQQPLTNLLGRDHVLPRDGVHQVPLPPYAYRWYRLGPLLDAIQREPG